MGGPGSYVLRSLVNWWPLLHLRRVEELLDELLANAQLIGMASGDHGAMALLAGVQDLRSALTAPPRGLRLSDVLAQLHRLRGLCDFEPLKVFAPRLDEAIDEATQTAMLA